MRRCIKKWSPHMIKKVVIFVSLLTAHNWFNKSVLFHNTASPTELNTLNVIQTVQGQGRKIVAFTNCFHRLFFLSAICLVSMNQGSVAL